MTKIVYNDCYGGFGLSDEAMRMYLERKGLPYTEEPSEAYFIGTRYYVDGECFSYRGISRSDPILVQVVEELGELANGRFSRLRIRELEPGTRYRIDEYDGLETVKAIHDYKWLVA